MKNRPKPNRRFVIAMFFLTSILNASGLASIVDGYYKWSSFFQNFIETYRHLAGFIVLPFELLLDWQVPNWVPDIIVVYGSLVIGLRLAAYWTEGGDLGDTLEDIGNPKWYEWPFAPIIHIVTVIFKILLRRMNRKDMFSILLWLLFATAPVIVLMFIDWQILSLRL